MIFPGMSGRLVRGFPKGAMFEQRGSQHCSLKSSCRGLNLLDPVVALPFFSVEAPASFCLLCLERSPLQKKCWAYLGSCCIEVLNRSHHWQGLHMLNTCIVVGHHVILHSCCERPPSLTVAFIMSYPSCWWLSPHYFSFPVQGIDNHQPFNIFANIHVPEVSPQFSHVFQFSNISSNFPYPIGSMYGIYANIWGILMVNVTIYSIHGSYGL